MFQFQYWNKNIQFFQLWKLLVNFPNVKKNSSPFFSFFFSQSPQRYILSIPSDEDEEDDLEDEQICLQDLVAMETMEQARDHDNDGNISDCIDDDLVEDEELIK